MILDSKGREITGKLTEDEVRMLIAIQKLPSDHHIDGLLFGIEESKGIPFDKLKEIVRSLYSKKFVQPSQERGFIISTKGWNFLVDFNKALTDEQKILRTFT